MTHRILRLFLLPLLLVFTLAADDLWAQNCFNLSDSVVNVGDILTGGTAETTISITPHQSTTFSIGTEIDGVPDEDVQIISNDRIGDTIFTKQGAATQVTIRLDSVPSLSFAVTLVFAEPGGCKDTLRIMGFGIGETQDGVFLPLTPGLPQTYAYYTDTNHSTRTILIRNMTMSTIRLDSVNSMDPTVVRDLKHPALPDTIEPQGIFSISFTFVADSIGYHRSGVVLPTDIGLASEYSIQVIRSDKASGSVPPLISKSGIRISQTTGEIMVDGLPFDRGEFTIYDLMGRPVRQHEITASEFLLQKRDDNGQPLTDGCYIIHVRDKNGRHSEGFKLLLLSY